MGGRGSRAATCSNNLRSGLGVSRARLTLRAEKLLQNGAWPAVAWAGASGGAGTGPQDRSRGATVSCSLRGVAGVGAGEGKRPLAADSCARPMGGFGYAANRPGRARTPDDRGVGASRVVYVSTGPDKTKQFANGVRQKLARQAVAPRTMDPGRARRIRHDMGGDGPGQFEKPFSGEDRSGWRSSTRRVFAPEAIGWAAKKTRCPAEDRAEVATEVGIGGRFQVRPTSPATESRTMCSTGIGLLSFDRQPRSYLQYLLGAPRSILSARRSRHRLVRVTSSDPAERGLGVWRLCGFDVVVPAVAISAGPNAWCT